MKACSGGKYHKSNTLKGGVLCVTVKSNKGVRALLWEVTQGFCVLLLIFNQKNGLKKK